MGTLALCNIDGINQDLSQRDQLIMNLQDQNALLMFQNVRLKTKIEKLVKKNKPLPTGPHRGMK